MIQINLIKLQQNVITFSQMIFGRSTIIEQNTYMAILLQKTELVILPKFTGTANGIFDCISYHKLILLPSFTSNIICQ